MPMRAGLFLVLLVIVLGGCGRPDGWSASNSPGAGFSKVSSAALHAPMSGSVTVEVPAAKGDIHLKGGEEVTFAGWAFDDVHKAACSSVSAVVDDKWSVPSKYGAARSDVASYYKNYAYNYVGYALPLFAKDLGRGTHHVYIVCMDSAGILAHRGVSTFAIDVEN